MQFIQHIFKPDSIQFQIIVVQINFLHQSFKAN